MLKVGTREGISRWEWGLRRTLISTRVDKDIRDRGLNHCNREDLLYDMSVLNRVREIRGLFKECDIGKHVVFLGFRRVTPIPFLKSEIAQEDTFESTSRKLI